MVLAGIIAEGETVIYDIYHLDRGYEHIDSKLKNIGAELKNVFSLQELLISLKPFAQSV